jgi:hypothetical protein
MSGLSGLGGMLNSLAGSGSDPLNDGAAEQFKEIGRKQIKNSLEAADIKAKVTYGQSIKDTYTQVR